MKKILSLALAASMIVGSTLTVSANPSVNNEPKYTVEKAIMYGEHSIPLLFDDKQSMGDFYIDVISNNPRLYNANTNYSFSNDKLKVDYLLGRNLYEESIDEFVEETNKLIAGIRNSSEEAKALAVYNRLISHCEYDYSKDSINTLSNTAYGAIVDGKANQRGLSLAYKHLLDAVGVRSQISQNDDYIWNVVNVNGQEYNSDIGKAVKCSTDGGATSYNYFLVSDSSPWLDDKYKDDINCVSSLYNSFFVGSNSLVIRNGMTTYYELNGTIYMSTKGGAIATVNDVETWPAGKSYCRIAMFNDDLYYTTPYSVIKYDTINRKYEEIFTLKGSMTTSPDSLAIYGLTIDDGAVRVNIASDANLGGSLITVGKVDMDTCKKVFAISNWYESIDDDVNNDGDVNILDATCIQRYLCCFEGNTPYNLINADVNKDGCISIIDATCVQLEIAGMNFA